MKRLIKRWILKKWFNYKYEQALNDVARLEQKSSFIDKFFLGETKAKIKREEWYVQLKEAKERFEKYKNLNSTT